MRSDAQISAEKSAFAVRMRQKRKLTDSSVNGCTLRRPNVAAVFTVRQADRLTDVPFTVMAVAPDFHRTSPAQVIVRTAVYDFLTL